MLLGVTNVFLTSEITCQLSCDSISHEDAFVFLVAVALQILEVKGHTISSDLGVEITLAAAFIEVLETLV